MTDTELNAKILRLHKAGKNPVQISEELGTHSRAAVDSKLRRQGIKPNRVPRGTVSTQGDVQDRQKIVDLVERALQQESISPDEVKKLSGVRVSKWQVVTKDLDGEPQVTDLEGHKVKIELTPAWADGPDWPVVQQAKPTVIKPVKVVREKGIGTTVAILADPQIGYRRFEDGTLQPFHDERVMDIALQLLRVMQPQIILNLGDTMDFPEWGKYEQEASFQMTTQPTLDRAHRFLAEQRTAVADAVIKYFEGNHERRIVKSIRHNAMAAFGLRRANIPGGWPVLSVPHLLRFDELDVDYVDGYPANRLALTKLIQAIHGEIVRSAGSTAKAVSVVEIVSTIYGHLHRKEQHWRTMDTPDGKRITFSYCPGAMCHIDGRVPSVKSSTDAHGRPKVRYMDWQQGIGFLTFDETGLPSIEDVFVDNGKAIFRGELYTANTSKAG